MEIFRAGDNLALEDEESSKVDPIFEKSAAKGGLTVETLATKGGSEFGEGLDPRNREGVFRVTELKPALRDQNRVNIFINEKFEFSLDIAQVVDFKIKVGQVLSEEEIRKYRRASEFGKLYQRSLEWVLTRPHSIKETRDYLERRRRKRLIENQQRKNNQEKPKEIRQKYHLKVKTLPVFEREDCEKILERLIERGYLDDQKFAEYYIENRFVKKGVSRRRLEQELTKKGLRRDEIEAAFSSSSRDEKAEIRKIIAKKRKRYDDDKLIQYLIRQGFDYHSAKAEVQEFGAGEKD